MIPVFSGIVKNGVFELDHKSQFNDYVKSLNDCRCELTIRKARSKRSNNQNSYYWGICLPILGDYFGYDSEEMHEALKMKFLRRGACDLETVTSTTKLNTSEFEEYLEKIRRWALSDYNIVVPLPNEIEP